MRVWFAFALSLVVSVVACSDAAPTAPTPIQEGATPAIHVTGRLIDFATGQGVANVPMTWSPRTSGSATVKATTDASGRYDVALPIVNNGFAVETPLGDLRYQSDLVRVPGKRLETDLLFNGGPCAARYGYVFDAVTRQPIAGARVSRAGSAITDDRGYYRIDIGCVPHDFEYWGIGTTTISVQHPAYQGAFEFDGRRESTSFSGVHRYDFALQPIQ